MINSVLRKACNQTAVYWANPVNNGTGGYTFDDPVEIKVRWEDKHEIVMDSKGEEFISQASVYVLQDVSELGYLYLGTLNDLDSAEEDAPEIVSGSYQIRKFNKSPDMRGTKFIRKVYLGNKKGAF